MPVEEQTQYNSWAKVKALPGGARRRGQRLTIPARQISSLSFMLMNFSFYGSTPYYYTYSFQIHRVSDDAVLASIPMGWYGNVPASGAWKTGTLGAPLLINEEVRIGVYATLGTSTHYLLVAYQTTDVKAGEYYSYRTEESGAWTDIPGQDFAYRYTYSLVTPTVVTGPATDIGLAEATINGLLEGDGGVPCDCAFEWGPTEAYGHITSLQQKTAGERFSEVLTGLEPDTFYHFRTLASNIHGLSYGSDRVFRTANTLSRPFVQDPLISLLEETV